MVPKPAGEVRILLVYRLVGDCIFCEEYEAVRTLELEGKIKMDKNRDCFGADIEAVITSFNQGTMILEAVESLCAQTLLPKK